jgi:Leucine-rich repeat (LRR) protein
MFIKKDLRKIPVILEEASAIDESPQDLNNASSEPPASKRVKQNVLTELNLSKRKAEFQGNVRILCQPSHAPSLRNLVSLSLYDCNISSLEGIGMLGLNDEGKLGCPNLSTLNLGRNPLKQLPDELGKLKYSLKELWCDDCQVPGSLPTCILELSELETLYMANNQVTDLPTTVGAKLTKLRRLCLDGNKLERLPSRLPCDLESLMVRHNQLSYLPAELPPNLRLLHASSNQLETLPALPNSIEILLANTNRIGSMPVHFPESLQRLNLSNNQIAYLPIAFEERFGSPDNVTGKCEKDGKVEVYIGQNPCLREEDPMDSETQPQSSVTVA